MQFLAFAVLTGLGLFVSYLVKLWSGLFDNIYVAGAIWIGACIIYAAIYDRRQARLRRSIEAQTRGQPRIEH